jgi:hypothetical protein
MLHKNFGILLLVNPKNELLNKGQFLIFFKRLSDYDITNYTHQSYYIFVSWAQLSKSPEEIVDMARTRTQPIIGIHILLVDQNSCACFPFTVFRLSVHGSVILVRPEKHHY